MAHYLYRINGGEIQAVKTTTHTGFNAAYFQTYEPATTPDGEDLVPAKIRDGTALRNATAGEITTFGTSETADDKLIKKAADELHFDSLNAALEYRFRGLMLQIRDEINTIRADADIGLAAISEATWIANIKTKITNEA